MAVEVSATDENYPESLRESQVPPAVFSTCSICIAPLISNDQDKHINNEYYNETEFPKCTKNGESFIIEDKTLFKILDIKPKTPNCPLLHENPRNAMIPKEFPVCKPCYIEITKYEKLQIEMQRIVDQIVTTVLENLEFNSGIEETNSNLGGSLGQNAMESLRELIFKRWKPQVNDELDQSITNDNCSYSESSTISSSVLKAIAEAFNVQPHELITGPVVGNESNSSITVELVSSSGSGGFKIPSPISKENSAISYVQEIASGTFVDTQDLIEIQRPIHCGNDLNLEIASSSNNNNITSLVDANCDIDASDNRLSTFDLETENSPRNMIYNLQNCNNCSDADSLENIEQRECLNPAENVKTSVPALPSDNTKKCPFCDELFPSSQTILVHLNSDHPLETTVYCERCQQYVNLRRDDDHTCHESSTLRPDRKGPFICTQCRKEFRQQRDLDVHVRRSHTGERPYICDVCGNCYPAQSTLQHHRKVHSQRFICDICGIAIVTETGLKKHMQIHEGTKDFQCEICSRKFMWKQSLLKHQAIHSEDKPFSCNFCSRTFSVKNYLDKHINRRHPENQNGQTEILNCPYCPNAKFRTPGNLSAHILRKHSSASASFV